MILELDGEVAINRWYVVDEAPEATANERSEVISAIVASLTNSVRKELSAIIYIAQHIIFRKLRFPNLSLK